jgi:preprotein translocase subunit SecD
MLTALVCVRTWWRMKLSALVAALALIAACATPPDPDHRPTPAEVQPKPSASHRGIYFKVVDDNATTLKQLFDSSPAEPPDGVTRATERWHFDDEPEVTGIYLTAPSRDALAHYATTLAVPSDHELVYGRVDATHWRTYLVFSTAELDAHAIAHATPTHNANGHSPSLMLDLTPAGAKRFGELTTRITGHRLAVLVDGTVVSAPVVRGAITGAHAEISFAPGDDAQARALADDLDASP